MNAPKSHKDFFSKDRASRVLTVIDLFAGAGGFSLAAKNLGMNILAAVENDKWARETYSKNFIDNKDKSLCPKLYGDITEIDPKEFKKELGLSVGQLDVLLGGPPCQGFSTHRINDSGVDDPRNLLLESYFKFLNELKPKVFLVENVSGILWKRHESHLNKFLKEADKAGYSVQEPVVLNARDFGVPQNRKRVFIVGFRKNLKLNFQWPPSPTHFPPESGKSPYWRSASEVFEKPRQKFLNEIHKAYLNDGQKIPELKWFNEKSKNEDQNNLHMNHSEEMITRFANTKINGSRKDSGFTLKCHEVHDGHKDCYGRIRLDQPGNTMTTGCVNPSRGRFVHPWENHGITSRHAARFQTFPESFIFEGGLMAASKQIGNAVPIKLGEALLNQIIGFLRR